MELKEKDAIKQCEKFIKAFKEDDVKSVIGFDVQALEQVIQLLKDKNDTIYELNNFLLNNGLMFKSSK